MTSARPAAPSPAGPAALPSAGPAALPAAGSAVRRLALVAALLAGALGLLGTVTVDPARAAGAAAVREGVDRPAGPSAQAGAARGSAESGPQGVRALLRAALPGAGPALGVDPDLGAGAAATALHVPLMGASPALPAPDGRPARSVGGPGDRAPPRTAGT